MEADAAAGDIASDVFGPGLATAEAYVELLRTVGVEWGLIGPRESARIWERHIFNSVAVREVVAPGVSVVDVGSGAGLPGIPLAIARPDLRVTLLEPLLRRVTFLERVVSELALGERVRVVRGRAEDWGQEDGRFGAVVSRAVAPLDRLVGWTRGLRSPGGAILALKGSRAESEVAAAAAMLRTWRLQADVVEVRADVRCEATRVARVTALARGK
nr:16S rRNA (guanine(527)-N(7))-methyltransferase RsmG [Propionicicella superfundia]